MVSGYSFCFKKNFNTVFALFVKYKPLVKVKNSLLSFLFDYNSCKPLVLVDLRSVWIKQIKKESNCQSYKPPVLQTAVLTNRRSYKPPVLQTAAERTTNQRLVVVKKLQTAEKQFVHKPLV